MPKKPKDTNSTGGQWAAIKSAIGSSQAVAVVAMKDADGWQKAVVYVLYGIIAIALFYLGVPPYQANKQITGLIVVIVLLFVVAIFLIYRYAKLSARTILNGKAPVEPKVKEPITIHLSGVVLEKLRVILDEARKQAHAFLKIIDPTLPNKNVRANIFLPEYGESHRWDDYVLKITPGLHLNMDAPETGIILNRGQGVTDKVFQSGEARVAQRLPLGSASSGWDAVYKITDELAAVIHPDLKWIISMPLNGGQAGRCIGVMNVDCLGHEFTLDNLFDCAAKLTTFPYTIFGLVNRDITI